MIHRMSVTRGKDALPCITWSPKIWNMKDQHATSFTFSIYQGRMERIFFVINNASWPATWMNLHPCSSAPLSVLYQMLWGVEALILQGVPVDCIHTAEFKDRESCLQRKTLRVSTNLSLFLFGKKPKDLCKMAGNGMSVRCVMVALAVALRSLNVEKTMNYVDWMQLKFNSKSNLIAMDVTAVGEKGMCVCAIPFLCCVFRTIRS